MDVYILSTAAGRFFLFLIVHFLVIRLVKAVNLIQWFIFPLALSIILTTLLELIWFPRTIEVYITILISIIYTCLFVIIYLLGFFGMMLASLRIRLLTVISGRASKGISQAEILSVYNKEKIVQHRLDRLVQNGDLGIHKNQYFVRKHFSPFFIHGLIFDLLKKLYLRQAP